MARASTSSSSATLLSQSPSGVTAGESVCSAGSSALLSGGESTLVLGVDSGSVRGRRGAAVTRWYRVDMKSWLDMVNNIDVRLR